MIVLYYYVFRAIRSIMIRDAVLPCYTFTLRYIEVFKALILTLSFGSSLNDDDAA